MIVHIFGPMEREYYRLERLWSEAPTVVYLQ
ncbi:MAG TPA: RsfS/YbeB/iojap family protein [Ktedonobacterales bacterium]